MKHWAIAALGATMLLPAQAQAATFDFENFTPTFVSPDARTGALTSLTDTKGGITMDISRQSGAAFDLVDNSAPGQDGKPVGWGMVSLDPFIDTSLSAFIADFSVALSAVSIEMGDYGADSDTLTLDAYAGLGGTGAYLGGVSVALGTTGFPGSLGAAFVDPTGSIRSVMFRGGGQDFPNSVFYDNITVRAAGAVPEPASWAMMVGGMGLLGGALRARRKVRPTMA